MRVHLELHVAGDWWPLVPWREDRMVGGTERFALRLAYELTRRAHDVTLRGGGAEGAHRGVRFVPGSSVVGDVDALVCVQADPPPDVTAGRRIAWSHAVQWPTGPDWDTVVVGSSYHAGVLRERLPTLPVDVLSPGCEPDDEPIRARDRFLYASSPDRGLHRLLAIWPALWRTFGVPLSVTYDARAVFARYRGGPGPLSARLREVEARLDQPGVVVHGPLTDPQLRSLRARSVAMLYPLDPILAHSELLSLAVREACAAGCPPILAPVDCFPSEYGGVARLVEPGGATYEAESWIAAIREVLDDHPARSAAARRFAAGHTWAAWADGWEALLEQRGPASPDVPPPRLDWVVVVGSPDEAGLMRPLLEAAGRRGHRLHVFAQQDAPESEIVEAAAVADRVVLCSGRGLRSLLAALGRSIRGTPVVTLDPSAPEWLDEAPEAVLVRLALVAWPQRVLDGALDGASPIFRLSPGALARTRAVGWLPTRRVSALDPLDPPVARLDLESTPPAVVDALRRAGLSGLSCADPIEGAGLLIAHPEAASIGQARALGLPVLVLAPGRTFGPEPYCTLDRVAQALFLAEEVEVAHGELPPEALARTIRAALAMRPSPSGGGAERAVRLIEDLGPPALLPRPPELRP